MSLFLLFNLRNLLYLIQIDHQHIWALCFLTNYLYELLWFRIRGRIFRQIPSRNLYNT